MSEGQEESTSEKPEECDACGFGTKKLKFWKGQGRADGRAENVPWTLADHWFCRLCSTGLGDEVRSGRVNHGIAQALNVILETLEKR